VKQLRRFEPIGAPALALAFVFLLLLAGLVLGGVSGGFSRQGLAGAAVAALIVASGLLYAWRLGAPGRRE